LPKLTVITSQDQWVFGSAVLSERLPDWTELSLCDYPNTHGGWELGSNSLLTYD